MVEYDPAVIREFAEGLYKRAETIVIVNAVTFGLLGAAIGGIAQGAGLAVLGLAAGAGLGYFFGLQKTFLLKLQAQSALCQVKIEENTQKSSNKK